MKSGRLKAHVVIGNIKKVNIMEKRYYCKDKEIKIRMCDNVIDKIKFRYKKVIKMEFKIQCLQFILAVLCKSILFRLSGDVLIPQSCFRADCNNCVRYVWQLWLYIGSFVFSPFYFVTLTDGSRAIPPLLTASSASTASLRSLHITDG